MTTVGSTMPRTRIAALDVARGVAILGTLGTNIWIFTDPAGIVGYIETAGSDPWPQRILMQLAQGKFLGLLTLMFGIGLAIQAASARRGGRAWPGNYRTRAFLLFIDGLVHYFLVAEFDVLMGYAAVSMLLCGVVVSSRRTRMWIVGTAAIVHMLFVTALVIALAATPASGDSSSEPTDVFATGNWWDLVVFRAENFLAFRSEVIFLVPLTIAMFLVGAALFDAGIFDERGVRLRRRLLLIGAVAAPVDIAVGLFGGPAGTFAARYAIAPFVAAGLLALIAQWYSTREQVGTVGGWMQGIGRTALSCYILQNIIASAICYGWGLGLAAKIDPTYRTQFTVAVYIAVCAILVVASRLWLRHFRQGPVEWLWKASFELLTRGSSDRAKTDLQSVGSGTLET
ncbi:DUF418 domain-containing protein [Rhodococcus sp. HNM0563]|uniref:DUF418 domain-containing protein n=1 Tax=unclassified Rhodococcus (in: high G+C Gram-positive bacteria) TaxID=192944 RepID=UPI00146AC66F|nr:MULTISPECIES: DUF418 domain-containing protein [unclassified Rhodococcus (in: high G+C Gram-positive bacteria)]MCK0090076.1 DUF418 domain-containing protein [Rhodococcus sp. F64268]NLU64603.1 DUF418 domain-containing protein [Rhodococcus sp. HNM0563]